MKKRIACLLTALVVLSCATPVLANPSAETEQPKVEAAAKAADGTAVEVTVEQTVAAEVKAEAKTEAAKVDAKASVVAVVEVDLANGVTMPDGGIVLTLKVEGVKAGDNVVLLHQKDDKSWETIKPIEVKDGEIVAKFESLSPVAIVKLPAATTSTAPKADKAGASLVLPVAALVCAAGATVCGRKVKFN